MPVLEGILESEDSLFAGDQLKADEIDRAAEYLHQKGLIKGPMVNEMRGTVRGETTTSGDECVERYGGDVSEYERRHDRASGPTFNIGSNTGNIAANSRDFSMSATTRIGVNVAGITMFARALRQAAPVLGLPDGDAEELVETADRLEQEAATGDPDTNRIQRWGASALGILNSPVVSGALGNVLAEYGQTVLPGLAS